VSSTIIKHPFLLKVAAKLPSFKVCYCKPFLLPMMRIRVGLKKVGNFTDQDNPPNQRFLKRIFSSDQTMAKKYK
jgi:hypothetical protein